LDTARLRVDKEQRDIDNALQTSRLRDEFVLLDAEAAQPNDLQAALLKYEPQIVHFSGHGSDEGIIMQNAEGFAQAVSTAALANLFKVFEGTVQCVVLNSCYSEAQAQAIAQYVPYIIGSSSALPDEAATNFATAFYQGLGAGKTIEFAYELGKNALQLTDNETVAMPILHQSKTGLVLVNNNAKNNIENNIEKTETAQPLNFKTIAGIAAIIIAFLAIGRCGFGQITATEKTAAPTLLQADITENLDLPKGEYAVKDHLHIKYGATLHLAAGATVRFAQNAELTVEIGGAIIAEGTAQAPVTFCGQVATKGFWGGIIILSNTPNNRIAYAKISDTGYDTDAAIHVGNFHAQVGALALRNSAISNGKGNGVYVHPNSVIREFENNTISGCDEYAVMLADPICDQIKSNNRFAGNKFNTAAVENKTNRTLAPEICK
jgi:hypothetical protein